MDNYIPNGTKVWFADGKQKLSKGIVIHSYVHMAQLFYVIEVQTGIEPIYMVRDWDTISLTKKGPLNFWRNLKQNASPN